MTTQQRHLDGLAEAHAAAWNDDSGDYRLAARADYIMIRSVVRAVTPGRQQAKNLAPLMDAAVKAAARVIRRRK